MKVIFLNEDDSVFPFRQTLLQRFSSAPQPDVLILVAFGFEDVAKISRHQPRAPHLLLSAVKDTVSIGPRYVPGQSACLSCLFHWLATAQAGRPMTSVAAGEPEAVVAADWILSRDDKHGDWEKLQSTLLTYNLSNERWSAHPIFPLSDCGRCASVAIPEKYPLRVHCSSVTGIVQKMQITQAPTAGAYRAVGTWVSPLPVRAARPLLAAQESHGRGRSREEAELGCIGEALERYSVIYRGNEALQRAPLSEIAGVDPRDILLYSDQQYRDRHEWNHSAEDRYFVGEPFDASQPIDWFPAVDLLDGSPAFVPAACTLMWYQFQTNEAEYARADSIGCGSGWTVDDALAHALLEWIERDAMAIWWYNRIRRPGVRLESVDTAELRMVREGLERIDRDLVLLDCTTDTGIPTYISVAARKDGTEPLFAGASHPSPRVAAWKAASEVGQLWFTIIHNNGIDPEMKAWLGNTTHTQPYLKPTHEVDAPDEPSQMTSSQHVRLLVDNLKAAGLHPYAADLSRADVLLKTVRAVVPGLRHIWNRRAPGRLYDVPVRLGWLGSALQEHQLNPILCMI